MDMVAQHGAGGALSGILLVVVAHLDQPAGSRRARSGAGRHHGRDPEAEQTTPATRVLPDRQPAKIPAQPSLKWLWMVAAAMAGMMTGYRAVSGVVGSAVGAGVKTWSPGPVWCNRKLAPPTM